MNKKDLAEMIKVLRKKKLEEVIGKPSAFNPMHNKATHPEDPESPNQYTHRVSEARVPIIKGGAQGKATLGKLEVRTQGQRNRGIQNQRGRYLGEKEQEVELGSTDTGKKGEETDTVTVNPKDKTMLSKGSQNKPISVQEIKEK